MKFLIAAFLLSTIAAIHYESKTVADNHGNYKREQELQLNVEKIEAARVQQYQRPHRFHYVKRNSNSCSSSSSSSEERKNRREHIVKREHNKDYRRFPQVEKTEAVKVVKVGDAQ